MFDRFGFPGLFAAYNAGPDRYDDHLQRGRPLPAETVHYLKQLDAAGISAGDMDQFPGKSPDAQQLKSPSGRSLFFLKDGVSAPNPSGEILVPLGSGLTRSAPPNAR